MAGDLPWPCQGHLQLCHTPNADPCAALLQLLLLLCTTFLFNAEAATNLLACSRCQQLLITLLVCFTILMVDCRFYTSTTPRPQSCCLTSWSRTASQQRTPRTCWTSHTPATWQQQGSCSSSRLRRLCRSTAATVAAAVAPVGRAATTMPLWWGWRQQASCEWDMCVCVCWM